MTNKMMTWVETADDRYFREKVLIHGLRIEHVALYLHSRLCRADHTEGCSYLYEAGHLFGCDETTWACPWWKRWIRAAEKFLRKEDPTKDFYADL